MAYTAKDYSNLIGMEGFGEILLKNHFTLYQGYVTNTNKLMDSLSTLLKEGKVGTPEYSELKRRMGFEFIGEFWTNQASWAGSWLRTLGMPF